MSAGNPFPFRSPEWHKHNEAEIANRPTANLKRMPQDEQNEFHQRLRDAAREKGRGLTDEEVAKIHSQAHSKFS